MFKMEKIFYKELREKVKSIVGEKGNHDINHVARVHNFAVKISEGLDVDLDVVRVSALLHDICKNRQGEGIIEDHSEQGAVEAREILEKTDFPKEKIELVCKCIRMHNKPEKNLVLGECRILNEADGLDAVGAIGIGRFFTELGKKMKLYDSSGKSKSVMGFLQDYSGSGFFKIPKARELAREKIEFMKDFNKQFIKEWGMKIK